MTSCVILGMILRGTRMKTRTSEKTSLHSPSSFCTRKSRLMSFCIKWTKWKRSGVVKIDWSRTRCSKAFRPIKRGFKAPCNYKESWSQSWGGRRCCWARTHLIYRRGWGTLGMSCISLRNSFIHFKLPMLRPPTRPPISIQVSLLQSLEEGLTR